MKLPSGAEAVVEKLGALGFERFRRALAALSLSFFAIVYTFLAVNAPEGWGPAFAALGACYVVAFFAVVAEWFWGRWFATGIGWSGLMVAIISLVMIGWMPVLAVYGALHALIVLPLAGKSMAARYDLQEGWRKRYRMDDLGVARLRKTITRSAASLPSLILWALGPKEPGQGMLVSLAALGLLAVGFGGLLRLRTWGWLAVGAAGLVAAVSAGALGGASFAGHDLAAVLLLAAALPFAAPAVRFLRARSV
ncbi:MAG TPA: hypothetical protein VHO06_24635 [Polyangia bacterium]|nr:hypothetical protein [Polyangia bacterium]